MSASEKLKALEPVAVHHDLHRLIDALPQIVVVVEAAEKQADLVKDEEIEWRWPGLAEALTVLEDGLT